MTRLGAMRRSPTQRVVRADAVVERVAARLLQGAVEAIDAQRVEKLRKDFLLLVKNVPHVMERMRENDYETYGEFRAVVKNYSSAFNSLIFGDLKGAIDKDERLNDGDRRYLEKKLGEGTWSFYITLSDLPLPTRFPSAREVEAWDKKIRRLAQVAWKDLKWFLEWYEQRHKEKVTLRTSDRLVIEGFQLDITAYNEANEFHRDAVEQLRVALASYRRQASKVAPWLIQHQLPLLIDFNVKVLHGTAGEYRSGKYIFINPFSTIGAPVKSTVKTLAHEMAHHWWNHLDGKAEAFWDAAIRQDYGPLDIREVLEKWPSGTNYASGFAEELADKDPILALQVDVLGFGHGDRKYERRSDFEEALARGVTTLPVPQTPITGYAGKNTEEAFCEAVGMLVAYGPRAVHERIRHWLEIIIPGQVKTGTTLSIAARYLEARGALGPIVHALKAGTIDSRLAEQALVELEVRRAGDRWLIDADWMTALGPQHRKRAMIVVKSLARLVRDPDSAAEVPAGTLAFELNWLQGLINKADKKTFQHGVFEIVPHGVTGPKVRECLEALDKAHKAIHRKFPQVLYGRVFIVKNLSGHSSAASYVENGDVVYLSLKAKGSVGDVYALCHEFGHRFFYKFWKDKTQRDEFMRLSTTPEYREVTIDAAAREQIADEYVLIALARRDDATQPTPSELFLTWLTHVAGTPIGRSTQKLGVRFVKGEDVEAELRRAILAEKDFTIRTKELLREPEYVTPYGKRGGWTENFAEAFAHHVLGMTLPPGIGAIMGSL